MSLGRIRRDRRRVAWAAHEFLAARVGGAVKSMNIPVRIMRIVDRPTGAIQYNAMACVSYGTAIGVSARAHANRACATGRGRTPQSAVAKAVKALVPKIARRRRGAPR